MDRDIIFKYFAHILKKYHKEILLDIKDKDLGKGQLIIIKVLSRSGDGKTQDELSKMLLLDKTTVARTLQKMIKNGYVIRIKDKKDHRINRIYLTDKSKIIAKKMQSIKTKLFESLLEGISDDEFDKFLMVLKKMFENIERNIE